MNSSKVIVYTQPNCPPCQVVKEFLRHHNIEFEEYDVTKDKDARRRLVHKYHSYSTPTVVVGETVITGFDLPALEKALKLN